MTCLPPAQQVTVMKRPASLPWLMAALALIALPTQAQERESRVYLPAGSVDVEALIDPPARPDSPELQEQMAIVLWLQQARTPEQVAFVQEVLDLERFAPLLHDALLGVDGIELKQTIDAAIDEVRADYDAIKGNFDVPRPYETDERVRPVVEVRPVAAYPSGHAIRAIVYARLLADIFPDHKEALMELAHQVGYGRVTAGVHYPMDVLAGQKLGHAYADAILEQPAFEEAVERIRKTQPPPGSG